MSAAVIMNAELFSVGSKMFGLWDEGYAIYQQASAFVIPQRHLVGVAPETLNLLGPAINGGRYFYGLKGGADYE